jgi:hypothetical protein
MAQRELRRRVNKGETICLQRIACIDVFCVLIVFYLRGSSHISMPSLVSPVRMHPVSVSLFAHRSSRQAKYSTGNGTEHRSLLLCSGYWGVSRHFNYFTDLLLCTAFSLPCRFESVLPYFYIAYMCVHFFRFGRRSLVCFSASTMRRPVLAPFFLTLCFQTHKSNHAPMHAVLFFDLPYLCT